MLINVLSNEVPFVDPNHTPPICNAVGADFGHRQNLSKELVAQAAIQASVALNEIKSLLIRAKDFFLTKQKPV